MRESRIPDVQGVAGPKANKANLSAERATPAAVVST